MGSAIAALQAEIERLRMSSADGRFFVNTYDLRRVLDKDKVGQAVRECLVPVYQWTAVTERIVNEGKIVF